MGWRERNIAKPVFRYREVVQLSWYQGVKSSWASKKGKNILDKVNNS